MRAVTRFARFWYDFVVGDDWTIAVAVVALLAATALVARAGLLAWPVLPVGVTAVLGASVGRVRRAHGRATSMGDGLLRNEREVETA